MCVSINLHVLTNFRLLEHPFFHMCVLLSQQHLVSLSTFAEFKQQIISYGNY